MCLNADYFCSRIKNSLNNAVSCMWDLRIAYKQICVCFNTYCKQHNNTIYCMLYTSQRHNLYPVCLLILITIYYNFTNSAINKQLQQCTVYNGSQLFILNPIIQYFPVHILCTLCAVYNTSVSSEVSNQYYSCIISFCFYCWDQLEDG
jgi:hypothetical protein